MRIVEAVKTITPIWDGNNDGYGVNISITYEDGTKEVGSFEENLEHQVRLTSPMKWMRKSGEVKEKICSFYEYSVTKELIDNISALEDKFTTCDKEVVRLYS